MEKRKRRASTDIYKAEVVERIPRSGKSIGGVAKALDLTGTALRPNDPRPAAPSPYPPRTR